MQIPFESDASEQSKNIDLVASRGQNLWITGNNRQE
jgi:hypothetical protein